MKRFLIFLAAMLLGAPAYGQVRQSGNVTPTHVSCWTSSGVIQDCGASTSPYATTFGVLNGTGVDGICVQSDKPTAAGYQRACLGVTTAAGAILSVQSFGTAPVGGFVFRINGSNQAIPTITLPVTSGNAVCFSGTSGTLIDCGLVPGTGTLANTHIFVGNVSNVATDFGSLATFAVTGGMTLAPTSGDALTLAPNAATTTFGRGLVYNQTYSGTQAGNFFALPLHIENRTVLGGPTGAGVSFQGLDVECSVNSTSVVGSTNCGYFVVGLNAATAAGNLNRNYVALQTIGQANVSDGGTNTGAGAKGAVFGLSTIANAVNGATNLLNVASFEADVSLQTGSSSKIKVAVSAASINGDAVHGAVVDAGFMVGAAAGNVGFNDAYLVTNVAGIFPITSAGSILRSDSAGTVTHGVDLSLLTCSADCFKSAGFSVNGVGVITVTNTTQVSGQGGMSIAVTQTAPNASGSPADGAFIANWTLTAVSATNELVARVFNFSATNNLTGGGVISNLRVVDIAGNTNAGTVSASLDGIFIENGTTNGSVTAGAAIHIASWQGTTKYGILDSSGGIWQTAGTILSTSATAGMGYATGAGGTIVQQTNKSTTVLLNTVTGTITMNNATLNAATIVTFVFTNSAVAATDIILTAHESGGTTGAYTINCRATGTGTAACDVRNNTAGNLSEAVVIRFFVDKSVNS